MNGNVKITTEDHNFFAEQLILASKNAGIEFPMVYDEESFTIEVQAEHENVKIDLSSSYVDYRDADSDKRWEIVSKYVFAMRRVVIFGEKIVAPLDVARSHLLPLVCSRIETDNECYAYRVVSDGEFRPTPREKFSSDANLLVLHDMGVMSVPVRDEQLKSWGISFDEALAIAMGNLVDRTEPTFLEVKPGFFVALQEEHYLTSHILRPDLFINEDRFDDPVVMIPAFGCICVASKQSALSQRYMLDYVGELLSHTDTLSTQMYETVGGKFVEYVPDDAVVMTKHSRIRRLARWFFSMRQQREVQEYLTKRHDPTFVSTLMVMDGKDHNNQNSMCVWLDGKDTIFPEVDYIAIGNVKSNGGGYRTGKPMTWAEAMKKFGNRITQMDGFPNLYRVSVPLQKTSQKSPKHRK